MSRWFVVVSLCLLTVLAAQLLPAAPDGNAPVAEKISAVASEPRPAASANGSPDASLADAATSREAAIFTALGKPVGLEFTDAPLGEVVEALRQQLKIQIVCDPEAAKSDAKVTIHVHDISGRAALDMVLRPTEFDWDVCHEVLWIGSRDQKELQSVKVYNVADLARSAQGDDEDAPEFTSLIELIVATIEPQSWDSNGGAGTIAPTTIGGRAAIVVRQNRRTHEQIAKLLTDLLNTPRAIKVHSVPKADEHGGSAQPAKGGLAAPGAGSFLKPADPPSTLNISPERRAIAVGNNQLACELFAKLDNRAGNIAFSPWSITTAMAMAFAGARNETAAEIARVMHFTLDQHQLHPVLAALNKDMVAGKVGAQSQLVLANRLWGQNGHKFLDAFLTLNRDNYGAELGQVDFLGQTESARAAINKWAAIQTDQNIKEIIPPGGLTPLNRLVLTNAIYFDGKWSKPFETSATEPGKFFGVEKITTVPMMSQIGRFRYARIDGVQILEKPFDDNLAFTILLPAKGAGAMAALRSKLTADELAAWHGSLKSRLVQFDLPRFQLESEVPVKDLLTSLGIHRSFDGAMEADGTLKNCDFSGFDGSKDLYLSGIFHKAWVEVNEVGAKAAAGTAIGGSSGGMGMAEQPIVFRADHPFLFLIRDRPSGAVLFLGKVDEPERQGSIEK